VMARVRSAAALVLLLRLGSVRPHAILTQPQARPGQATGVGTKLTPFANAKTIADSGCGGSINNDPGVQVPTQVFTPGATVTVSWQLTIPHPADAVNTGVRVAVHYGPTDSFASNILAGGLTGDPAATPVSAGTGPVNGIMSQDVQLPAGKTCDYCTLQWVWAAQQDGGSYVGCADVSITASGQLRAGRRRWVRRWIAGRRADHSHLCRAVRPVLDAQGAAAARDGHRRYEGRHRHAE